jgi:hypothetical protein
MVVRWCRLRRTSLRKLLESDVVVFQSLNFGVQTVCLVLEARSASLGLDMGSFQ